MEQFGLDTPTLLLLTSTPLLLAFVTVVLLMLRARAKVNATRDWPQTMGRVLEVVVEEKVLRRNRRGEVAKSRFLPYVRYEYEVIGRSYQGSWARRDDGDGYTLRRMAEAALKPYAEAANTRVMVYYNPENPAEAVLSHEPGARTRTMGLVAIALLAALAVDVFIIGILLPRMLVL